MLIIEGPDGSGKTTLAKRVASEFEIPYKRYPGLSSEKGPEDIGIVDWWRFEIRASGNAVYDRCFFISENIYQLATKGRTLLTSGREMNSGLSDLYIKNACFIFCIPPWETSREIIRSQERKLQGVDEHDLEKIHWSYWSWYTMCLLATDIGECYHYDFTTNTEDEVMTHIAKYYLRRPA